MWKQIEALKPKIAELTSEHTRIINTLTEASKNELQRIADVEKRQQEEILIQRQTIQQRLRDLGKVEDVAQEMGQHVSDLSKHVKKQTAAKMIAAKEALKWKRDAARNSQKESESMVSKNEMMEMIREQVSEQMQLQSLKGSIVSDFLNYEKRNMEADEVMAEEQPIIIVPEPVIIAPLPENKQSSSEEIEISDDEEIVIVEQAKEMKQVHLQFEKAEEKKQPEQVEPLIQEEQKERAWFNSYDPLVQYYRSPNFLEAYKTEFEFEEVKENLLKISLTDMHQLAVFLNQQEKAAGVFMPEFFGQAYSGAASFSITKALEKKSVIYVPLWIGDHWSLGVYNVKAKTMVFIESLGTRRVLAVYITVMSVLEKAMPTVFKKDSVIAVTDQGLQEKSIECGYFVFAEMMGNFGKRTVAKDIRFAFSTEAVQSLRKKVTDFTFSPTVENFDLLFEALAVHQKKIENIEKWTADKWYECGILQSQQLCARLEDHEQRELFEEECQHFIENILKPALPLMRTI